MNIAITGNTFIDNVSFIVEILCNLHKLVPYNNY